MEKRSNGFLASIRMSGRCARYVAPTGYRRDIRIKSEMYKQQTVTVAGVANVLDDENAFRRLDGNCLSAKRAGDGVLGEQSDTPA